MLDKIFSNTRRAPGKTLAPLALQWKKSWELQCWCHWEDHEALGKMCCWSHPNFQIESHPWTCAASWWDRVWTWPKTWQRDFFHLWWHGGHASGQWCIHGPSWLHSLPNWLSWLVPWASQHQFWEATCLCHPYKLDFEGWQLKGQLWPMENCWTSPWNQWRQWWSWNLPQWSLCWWRLCLQTHLGNWTCEKSQLACLAEHCKQAMCYCSQGAHMAQHMNGVRVGATTIFLDIVSNGSNIRHALGVWCSLQAAKPSSSLWCGHSGWPWMP